MMAAEVMEPAHVAIVQITSIIALVAALIALYLIFNAMKKFSPGIIKQITSYKFVQIILFSAAMVFMVIYHVFDIDLFQDLWHLAAGIALLFGAYVAVQVALLSKRLR